MEGTLGTLVQTHARLRGASTALFFEGRETTYADLAAQAARVASALARTEAAGARIAYLGRNHDRCVVLMLGCALAGCVYTPVNWRLAEAELAYVLADSGADLLFHSKEHSAHALQTGARTVDVDDEEAWSSWLVEGDAPLPNVAADDVALQIYSSGTTGRPKGVELSHRSVLTGGETVLSGELGGSWSEQDRVLVPLPLFHVSALLMVTYALVSGAASVIVRDAVPMQIAEAARRYRATRTGLVPTVIQILLDSPDVDMRSFDDLKLIIYGGSSITPALLDRARTAFGCAFLQLFGMSETFTIGTILRPEDHDSGDPALLASCGQPLPGVEVRVILADGTEAPVGTPGEILIKTGSVMKGYWRLPEATAEAVRDGWYHTGDVGSFDARGYLTIRDRLKDMVISGGENIYPAEVEAALASHPSVAEVAVIGRPDPRWGEAVTAVVVSRGDAACEKSLIDHARARIAHYKCPSKVVFVEALPKNAGGKVLKRELRERLR